MATPPAPPPPQGHFRDELIEKVIFMCSRDKYAYLADFAWYLSVLVK